MSKTDSDKTTNPNAPAKSDWLAALIHAPIGGVVVSAPQPSPGAEFKPAAPIRPGPSAPEQGAGPAETPSPIANSETPGKDGATAQADIVETLRTIPLNAIRPNPGQPRRMIDETELHALAASIAEQGVIQPIVVRPIPGDQITYEIVAGERRWRAARIAGLASVSALVRALDDELMAEVALVENIQRAELAPLDEAFAFQQLIDRHGQTQDGVAKRLGKSRSHIAHMLRLLRLPDSVQALIQDGSISVGHARVLVNASDPESLARRVVSESLTVRQTEEAAKADRNAAPRSSGATATAPAQSPGKPDSKVWADRIGEALERPVAVKSGPKGGSVVIRYDTEDDLASILAKISR